MFKNLVESSDFIGVNTVEEAIFKELLFLSVWFKDTAIIINSLDDTFTEKLWLKDLEFLIKDGE